jgi:cyanate permease
MSAVMTESSRPGKRRGFAAGAGLNFALVFFFGSFMFVLTLLLQTGLGQSPLRAGLEAGPLGLTFTTMSILGPRLAARFGTWSITIGAVLDVLGTIGLVLTGLRYCSHLTGWDLAPATALIGLGQGMALPAALTLLLPRRERVRPAVAADEPATEYSAGAAH